MSRLTTSSTALLRKSAVASAMMIALGGSSIMTSDNVYAATLTYSFTGLFTLLNSLNAPTINSSYPYAGDPTWGNGKRTPITGTMTFNTSTGSGTATVNAFDFFGSGPAVAHNITMQAIGDGVGGAGTLVVGGMLFDWNGNNNISVGVVLDAAGYFGAGSIPLSGTISGTGSTPASDNSSGLTTLPIGPAPVAMTTYNTNFNHDPSCVAANTCLASNDTIGGSPMDNGPFPGFSANFDVTNLKLIDDGSGPAFTQPTDVNFIAPEQPTQPTPASINVNLGTVGDEGPGVTIDYSTDGKPVNDGTKTWVADNNGTNTIAVSAAQTVTTLTVDWRATSGSTHSYKTQKVTVTITDTTIPVITTPADVNVNVTATSDQVCFGAMTATDAVDPNPAVEWSHDGFTWNAANPTNNCSTGFGPNTNTVFWRAVDETGNTATYQQHVTLNLPNGIIGKACTVDLATAGARQVEGRFTMRDPQGSITGTVDNGVTGSIDTTVYCTDPDIANCNPNPPAAVLNAGQPFFGFDWTANPVRLFGPGDWTFETCPFPRTQVGSDFVSPDGSSKCGDLTTPNPLSMHVGPGQVGAHMLFDWSVNKAIDVVVVWDAGCNAYQLTATDPDGDGILASKMVDGPFKGFNAAFDVRTVAGEPPISDGGFVTTVPAVANPNAGSSPLPLTVNNLVPGIADPVATRSCVGGCFDFTTNQLRSASDGGGNYQYAQVVLPVSEAVPFWSLYRKYDTTTDTWGPFVIDSRNDVKTAPLDNGACPEPGNGSYDRPITGALADKLRAGDECVQLTIEDGGPNDADGSVDGSVSDPGGVAEVPATALPPTQSLGGGGCSLTTAPATVAQAGSWWLLAGFMGWLGFKRRVRNSQ
jgi:hypothetical protein